LVQGGTVSSPLAAAARLGTNNLTLSFMAGFTQDLNFTVVAEAGAPTSGAITIRIIQAPARNIKSWTLLVTAPGGFSATITDASPFAASFMSLPSISALGTASLTVIPGPGAYASPSNLNPAVPLGGRGVTRNYTFQIVAEDDSVSAPYTLCLTPALFNDSTWTVQVRGPPLATSSNTLPTSLIVNSATAPLLTVLRWNYSIPLPITIDNSSLSYWMAGLNCVLQPDVGTTGTTGVPADGNMPASRRSFATWSGADGHLYLYGQKSVRRSSTAHAAHLSFLSL
jgi:hypothetical protein